MSLLPVPLNVLGTTQHVLSQHVADRTTRASLPVPNSTIPFWLKDISSNEGNHEAPLIQDADICIIGSGISGVSIAYHLAKLLTQRLDDAKLLQPLNVIMIEARDFCSGATGRNGGHLTATRFEGFRHNSALHGTEDALRELAIQQHTIDRIVQILTEHDKADEADLIAGGHIDLYFTEQELASAQADFIAAQVAGADLRDVKWFSKEKGSSLYGTDYPSTRSPGNNLWPYKLVRLLYDLANKETASLSLKLFTHTPVTAVANLHSDHSRRRWSLTTPRGDISCSYVVHATNAYVSHLLPHMQGPDGVIPTRGQIIAVRAAAPTEAITKSSWCGNEGFEYWFPRPITSQISGGQNHPLIILGGGREDIKPYYEQYETDDSIINPEVGTVLRKFLPAVFPGLYEKDREPEMEWTGIMGFTKTGDPFVGPVIDRKSPSEKTYEGQYVIAGFSGHGMPRAFACAEALAGMLLADTLSEKWNVPRWLPRHYLTKEM